MSNDLYHLVYYSRNRIPAGADLHAEIDSILKASQRNNSRAQVTGALIFNKGVFAQVLEGTRRTSNARLSAFSGTTVMARLRC